MLQYQKGPSISFHRSALKALNPPFRVSNFANCYAARCGFLKTKAPQLLGVSDAGLETLLVKLKAQFQKCRRGPTVRAPALRTQAQLPKTLGRATTRKLPSPQQDNQERAAAAPPKETRKCVAVPPGPHTVSRNPLPTLRRSRTF